MSSAISRLSLRPSGTSPVRDSPGEALDDRGLADTGFADQDGVVLGAPRQDLDDTPDLVVTADDRIDLALRRAGGQILAVLLERGELLLRVRVGDAMAPAHVAKHGQQLLAADTQTVVHRQQQVFDRQVVVFQVLAVLRGPFGDVGEVAAHPGFVAAVRLGEFLDRLGRAVAHHVGGLAELGQDGRDDGAVLSRDRGQEMVGGQFGIRLGLRQIDRR